MKKYHGNNFARRSPSAPFPAPTKLSPNSDSCFHGLSNHMPHSWLNIHPDPTRKHFSGLLRQESGAGFFFGIFQLLYFCKQGEMEFFVSLICQHRNMYWHLASIRYLPSLQNQLHCVLCIASCRCKQTVSGIHSPETLCLHLYVAVHTVQWNWCCRLEGETL